MGEDEIEGVVGKRQVLAVGLAQIGLEPLLREVLARQRDRRRGQIDAGDERAASGEPDEIGAGAAADVEHALAAIAVEVDQPQQMVQLLEVVLIEVGEEPRRADRMRRDLEIVDVLVPVVADVGSRWRRAGEMTRRTTIG